MNLKRRIESLETKGGAVCPWVALKNFDNSSIIWNGKTYPDEMAFHDALQNCGIGGKLILLDD